MGVKKRHLLSQMTIEEVSLVDRGANQGADVLISKRATPEDLGKHAPTAGDVHAEEPLPDKKRKKKKRGDSTDDTELVKSGRGSTKMTSTRGSLTQDRPGAHAMSVNTDDLPQEVVDYIEKAEAYITELETEVSKAADAASGTEPTAEDEPHGDILKSIEDPAQRAAVGAILKRAEEAEQVAKAERDLRVQREFIEKARAKYTHLPMDPVELGPVLKGLHEAAPEQAEVIEDLLSKVDGSLGTSNVFKEFGVGGGADDTVSGRLEGLAKSLQEADPDLSKEAAVAKALAANPDLYDEYLRESEVR